MSNAHFEGEVNTLWLKDNSNDDRKMKLNNDFKFIDHKGKTWKAKCDYETDGASIPRFLWTVFGSPFIGDYRRGAVIHDYYYDNPKEPPANNDCKKIDRVFYHAIRTDGVEFFKAVIMYVAVRLNTIIKDPCANKGKTTYKFPKNSDTLDFYFNNFSEFATKESEGTETLLDDIETKLRKILEDSQND